ncbi:YbaB/EbfC family nucleoid-associated protein [Dactylosporangium sp. NPDC050688]|uniref:YbaB/EbfC family nucleoid-associated protein n=1 Tax=Dactylosporangium sp. NPDC050688 TaxID=3157217 RepID=UPI0033DA2CA1
MSLRVDLFAQHKKMAEDIRAVRQRMLEIRATAESDDGLISVTVDATHDIVELRLDPRIYRAPDSAALAKAIIATVRRAVRVAEDEAFAIVRVLLPEEATPGSADLRFDPLLHELDEDTARGAQR